MYVYIYASLKCKHMYNISESESYQCISCVESWAGGNSKVFSPMCEISCCTLTRCSTIFQDATFSHFFPPRHKACLITYISCMNPVREPRQESACFCSNPFRFLNVRGAEMSQTYAYIHAHIHAQLGAMTSIGNWKACNTHVPVYIHTHIHTQWVAMTSTRNWQVCSQKSLCR